jgi:hypothetical protein
MPDSAAQILGRKGGLATARSLTPEQRSENARNAANARWYLTYEQWKRLGDDGMAELLDYIKTAPLKARLTLSVAEWRALSNYSKAMALHRGMRVQHPHMARSDFERLSAGAKAKFINEQGGKVDDQ